jgi:hypothetical protein
MPSGQSSSSRTWVLCLAGAAAIICAALILCANHLHYSSERVASETQAASGIVGNTELIEAQQAPNLRPPRRQSVLLKGDRPTGKKGAFFLAHYMRTTQHARLAMPPFPATDRSLGYVRIRTRAPPKLPSYISYKSIQPS